MTGRSAAWTDERSIPGAIPYAWELARLPAEQDDAMLAATHPLEALALAWWVRETAPQRARALLDTLQPLALPEAAVARIALIESDWHYQNGELAACEERLALAQALAQEVGDAALRADCSIAERQLARSKGDPQRARQAVSQAQMAAEQARDPVRASLALVYRIWDAVLDDPLASDREDRGMLLSLSASPLPPVAAWANSVLGTLDYQLGRTQSAAITLCKAFEPLLASGQMVLASLCALNLSTVFEDLQDHDVALEWAQHGLDVARSTGFPKMCGTASFRVAERLRQLNRLDEALVHMGEARRQLQVFHASRNYNVMLNEAGALALARGELEEAAAHYMQARQQAQVKRWGDVEATALHGLAQTAFRAQDTEAAERWARLTLELPAGRPQLHAETLMTLARCALRGQRWDEALDFMRRAVVEKRGDALAPARWWNEQADCLARKGEYQQAYEARLRADESQQAEHLQQAQLRAAGLQARTQTMRLEAEASAARLRAELLEASAQTLTLLGEVGQQLTSLLDAGQIYETIYGQVAALLQAEFFCVYLVEQDGERLKRVFAAEGTQRLAPAWVAIDHPQAHSARCMREQCELLLDFDPHDAQLMWIPGTARNCSALFAPLRSGSQALGVLSIQAQRPNAFLDRERQIFRSLCAYASIAIANAQAYQELALTQRHLAQQQRLAAVGAMVAGVAHEMNTPIGNALLAANTLVDAGSSIQRAVSGGTLGKQQLLRFAVDVEQAGDLVVSSLQRAAQLVQDFKQLVLDRRTLQRGAFALRQLVEELPQFFATRLRDGQHRLDIDVPEGLELDAYREALGDLLRHWADNALQHGLQHSGGRLGVQARLLPGDRVELCLSDDGVGMAPEVLERAFEPFFSTQFSGRNSGLGMAVVRAVAVDLYGGELRLESAPGQGTTLHWVFPRVAPQGIG